MDDLPARDPAGLARDHLANERTWLAWLRTAIAVMALGLAIAGFGNTTTATSIVAGAILAATGTVGVYVGTTRYRQATRDLERGVYQVSRRSQDAVIAAAVLVLAIFGALITLLIGRR